MTTTESLAQRKRGMDRSAEQIADIKRIRAAGKLLESRMPESDALWLVDFLQMVASHSLTERSQLVLTPEQRETIDRIRKEHAVT